MDLAVPEPDEYGAVQWRPREVATSRAALEPVYQALPGPFPPLFEELLLSYRWATVDLDAVELLANPLSPALNGFVDQVLRDRGLADALLPKGLLQFARKGAARYDPICFVTSKRRNGGDCPIVQVDHEEILCHGRVKILREVAPTFRALVEMVLARAEIGRARSGTRSHFS